MDLEIKAGILSWYLAEVRDLLPFKIDKAFLLITEKMHLRVFLKNKIPFCGMSQILQFIELTV